MTCKRKVIEMESSLESVSIIVTVYNRERFLSNCIDSILAQEGVPFELLLIDDGSTDKSLDICRSYEKRYSNVRVFQQENAGISRARNVGLDNARGKYICFHDDDDVMVPGGLKVLYDAMLANEVDIAMGDFERVDEDGNHLSYSNMPEFVKNRVITADEYWKASLDKKGYFIFIVNWAKLYKREIWEHLRFPDEFRKAEDECVMTDILGMCKSIYVTDKIIHRQTITKNSITRGGFSITTLRTPESKLITTEKLIGQAKYEYAVKKWGIACGEIARYSQKANTDEIKNEVKRLFDWSCKLGKELKKYMGLEKKIKFLGYRAIYPFL